jgi:hypothetical protein
MHSALRLLVIVSALATVAALSGPTAALDWPARPVTVVVPFGAGGNTDMMARLAADHLSAAFGRSFIVENRPSAGGALATNQVATAAPDGYTLLFAAASMIVLTPQLQKLSFDPITQLVPITNMGTGTQMLAIKRSLPAGTLPVLERIFGAGRDAGCDRRIHSQRDCRVCDLAGDFCTTGQARHHTRRAVAGGDPRRVQEGLRGFCSCDQGRRNPWRQIGYPWSIADSSTGSARRAACWRSSRSPADIPPPYACRPRLGALHPAPFGALRDHAR